MANIRQYIGARYTIKIYENSQDAGSAEWEANTSYEPLVMVTYNNSSYLSKKDVPATIGNPAQNPLYWIVTGAYNGQIAALQAQIDAINLSLTNIVSDINTKETNMLNRKFLFVGDSYGDEVNEYPTVVKNSLSIPDDNFNNVCVSGAGFIDWGGGTYLDQLTNFAGDKSEITDIILVGGLNDSRYATYSAANAALSPAIDNVHNYINANYPNANTWIAYVGSCLFNSTYYATVPLKNRKICRYIYEVSGMQYNWRLLGGVVNALHTSTYNYKSDGIHPSSLGSAAIGQAIATVLAGGQYSTYYPPTKTVSLLSGYSGAFNCEYEVIGDATILSLSGTIEVTNGTFGANDVQIGALNQITLPLPVSIEINCVIDVGSGTPRYIETPCVFTLHEDKVYIRIEKLNSAGTGYDSVTLTNGKVYVNTLTSVSIPTFAIN